MPELAKVSPNRMELLKNKRRLALAQRGHKLLKDKYDELVRRFIRYINENKGLRAESESLIRELYIKFSLLRAEQPIDPLTGFLELTPLDLQLDVQTTNLLNIKVPVIDIKTENKKNYSAASTPLAADAFLEQMQSVMEIVGKLAQFEQTVRSLASEIEKTRRRVNALEYVLIPSLQANIRFIAMKMDELDRENRTRLMKTKELLLSSM